MLFDPIESATNSPSLSGFLRRRMRHLRGVSNWPIAEAKVLSCDWVLSEGAEGSSGEFEIQFIFDIAGISHYGSFSLPGYGSARLFASGDPIRIQYNPEDPNQSLYSEAWTRGEIFWLWVLIFSLIFFGHWLVTGSPWLSSSGRGN